MVKERWEKGCKLICYAVVVSFKYSCLDLFFFFPFFKVYLDVLLLLLLFLLLFFCFLWEGVTVK